MLRNIVSIGALLAANAFAQEQSSQTPPGWPCVGGRAVDPTYVRMAESTGGQVFLFDRSEAGRSLVLMREGMKHAETIFRATGTLAPGYRDFQFPVDTAIESLLFSISLQCAQSVAIYRPSGAELDASAPGVDDNRYRAGRIVVMSRPEPGIWQVRIVGAGLFFVVTEARSDVSLHSVQFVQVGGRPGHEGYFPMTTPVRLNVPQMLSASVSGTGVSGFRMIGSGGETLQPLELSANESGDEFQGPVTPTKGAFRIVVEGRDARGYPYQRIFPRLFKAIP
jgi:von Willebrand factor A domain-containing protein 7